MGLYSCSGLCVGMITAPPFSTLYCLEPVTLTTKPVSCLTSVLKCIFNNVSETMFALFTLNLFQHNRTFIITFICYGSIRTRATYKCTIELPKKRRAQYIVHDGTIHRSQDIMYSGSYAYIDFPHNRSCYVRQPPGMLLSTLISFEMNTLK